MNNLTIYEIPEIKTLIHEYLEWDHPLVRCLRDDFMYDRIIWFPMNVTIGDDEDSDQVLGLLQNLFFDFAHMYHRVSTLIPELRGPENVVRSIYYQMRPPVPEDLQNPVHMELWLDEWISMNVHESFRYSRHR